jgi:hypothetical protein
MIQARVTALAAAVMGFCSSNQGLLMLSDASAFISLKGIFPTRFWARQVGEPEDLWPDFMQTG